MKSDPTFWLLARASRPRRLRPAGRLGCPRPCRQGSTARGRSVSRRRSWTSTVFLALLGLGALALHGVALVADDAVDIGLGALFVRRLALPPFATALGVLAAELMVLIYLSFSVRRRIGAKAWRALHWLTYLVFALGTVHGLAAGSDSGRTWALALYGAAVGAVVGALAWHLVVPSTQGGPPQCSGPDQQVAL